MTLQAAFLKREWQEPLPRKLLSMYMYQRSVRASLKQNMTLCMPLVYHYWYINTRSRKAQMAGMHMCEVPPCSSVLGRQSWMGFNPTQSSPMPLEKHTLGWRGRAVLHSAVFEKAVLSSTFVSGVRCLRLPAPEVVCGEALCARGPYALRKGGCNRPLTSWAETWPA